MELMSLVPNESPEDSKLPRIIHNCEAKKLEDPIEKLIPGNRLIDKLRRWLIRKIVLNKNQLIKLKCIKSSASTNYEINRHITSNLWMIHPFSDIRCFWANFMTLFTIISLIIVPILLAFQFNNIGDSFYIILVINIVFAIDILMGFFTGYYDERTRIVSLDRQLIGRKYLKGFFVLDLLSAIPIEVIHIVIKEPEETMWRWNALNLMKILRLRTIVIYSRKLRYLYQISYLKYKIFEMSIIVILCIHWATCLELYVALAAREIDPETPNRGSWISSELMRDKDTKLKIYLACANRAMVSLTSSSHYLDVKTTEDILLNIFLTVLGRIAFIYIVAQFLLLMRTFHAGSKQKLKLLRQLQEYMRYKELPNAIRSRLLSYHEYWSKKKFDRNKRVIDQVSSHLREELLLHEYSRIIESVEYFRVLPPSVIARIVGFLKTEIYLTNDVIVKSESIGDALFFVASGSVAVYTSAGKEICHLEEGSHFGDVSLVMENERRTANVVAIEICEIWKLQRSDFLLCVSRHPDLLNRLQKIALENLEKNLFFGNRRSNENSVKNSPSKYFVF